MQFQSDILGLNCLRPVILETTALGAAFLAGLGVGFWSDIQDVRKSWREDAQFSPSMSQQQKEIFLSNWHEAVKKA